MRDESPQTLLMYSDIESIAIQQCHPPPAVYFGCRLAKSTAKIYLFEIRKITVANSGSGVTIYETYFHYTLL